MLSGCLSEESLKIKKKLKYFAVHRTVPEFNKIFVGREQVKKRGAWEGRKGIQAKEGKGNEYIKYKIHFYQNFQGNVHVFIRTSKNVDFVWLHERSR